MTYDQAAALIDAIVDITKKDIERAALSVEQWEQADNLAYHASQKRETAIEILMGVPHHA